MTHEALTAETAQEMDDDDLRRELEFATYGATRAAAEGLDTLGAYNRRRKILDEEADRRGLEADTDGAYKRGLRASGEEATN